MKNNINDIGNKKYKMFYWVVKDKCFIRKYDKLNWLTSLAVNRTDKNSGEKYLCEKVLSYHPTAKEAAFACMSRYPTTIEKLRDLDDLITKFDEVDRNINNIIKKHG